MTKPDSGKTTLRRLIDAVSQDHMMALEALSIIRVLSAAKDCKHAFEHNSFLMAVRTTAHEAMMNALWRMFDSDEKTAGIVGFCQHAKKHPEECEWLFSPAGKQRFPSGADEVNRLADYWLDWRQDLPMTNALTILRNNFVGHRGLKAWLGKSPTASITWLEVAEALSQTDKLVNDFRNLTDSTTVFHQNIYEQVMSGGSHLLAGFEAYIEAYKAQEINLTRFVEIRQEIRDKDKAQIANNKWAL